MLMRALIASFLILSGLVVGYYVAPAKPFTPAVIQSTSCTPKAVLGYVIILPDRAPEMYIGGIQDMSPRDKAMATALAKQGKLRLGAIHYQSPAACGLV